MLFFDGQRWGFAVYVVSGIGVDVLLAPRQNELFEVVRSGDEDILHLGTFWVCAGTHSRRRGLHPLPRATARQLVVDFGSGTYRRTAVASESPAA